MSIRTTPFVFKKKLTLQLVCTTVAIYFSLTLLFISCNSDGYIIHESGLEYRFIQESGSKIVPKEGELLVLRMSYSTEKDSLLFHTREISREFKMYMKKPSHTGGCIEDVFGLMHVGDSIEAKIDAEQFFTFTKRTAVPKFVQPGDNLVFNIRLIKVTSPDSVLDQTNGIIIENEEKEMELLEHLLKMWNVKTKPTESGLYFILKHEGDGPNPEAGNRVTVHYTGTYLDGRIFSTTLRTGQPFAFVLGENKVIEGWEEGIALMNVGSKAQLIIPSRLAYGKDGKDPIPPYSTLIFDIELLEIN